MASRADFFPDDEPGMVQWTRHFSEMINSSPSTYHLRPEQTGAYRVISDAFISAFMVARSPATRSPANVEFKNAARKAMEAEARRYNVLLRASGLTDGQFTALGFKVRKEQSRIGKPQRAPIVTVLGVEGNVVRVRVSDIENFARRGRPAGVHGALVLAQLGEEPSPDHWPIFKTTTHMNLDLVCPPESEPGTVVWICAKWLNAKFQPGPASRAVRTQLQFGVRQAA